jgi:NAD(P)H-nitrite reductase large subunit
LASGDRLPYDQLLIATGARQKIPPVSGLDSIYIRPLITINDAETLNQQIKPNQQALVIGAGLIGLEAAEALHKRGMSVTVIEMLPWVMPSVLDEGAGNVLAKHLIAKGIDIRTSTTVTNILTHPDGDGQATLSDGSTIQFAVTVLAAGVEPNLLIKEIPGLKVQQGIVVDNNGRTNLDNVFAAGDVAEAPDPLQDKLSLNLNWISAKEQGRITGRTMAGVAEDYQGSVALNSLNFLDCAVNTLGITDVPATENSYTELIDPTNRPGVYRKVILRRGKMVGAILIGDITFSGAYHRLIREQLDIGDLGSEILTGGYRFVQRLKELRQEDMEGDYTWREHVWEETPYKKKMNTHSWQRRTGQLNSGQSEK